MLVTGCHASIVLLNERKIKRISRTNARRRCGPVRLEKKYRTNMHATLLGPQYLSVPEFALATG